MICDFCLGSDVRWSYPAGAMELVSHPVFTRSVDDFAVCQRCHELLVRGDIVALAERMVRQQPLNVPPGTRRDGGTVVYAHASVRRSMAMAEILRFMDARLGPPVPT